MHELKIGFHAVAETRSKGEENIFKNKKVADSGVDCKTVSKHVVFNERM